MQDWRTWRSKNEEWTVLEMQYSISITTNTNGRDKMKERRKNIWRNYRWKVLNLLKNNKLHTQEVQQTLCRVNAWTHKHIIVKMLQVKSKGKILKAARKKWLVTYKESPIRLTADFSAQIREARR